MASTRTWVGEPRHYPKLLTNGGTGNSIPVPHAFHVVGGRQRCRIEVAPDVRLTQGGAIDLERHHHRGTLCPPKVDQLPRGRVADPDARVAGLKRLAVIVSDLNEEFIDGVFRADHGVDLHVENLRREADREAESGGCSTIVGVAALHSQLRGVVVLPRRRLP